MYRIFGEILSVFLRYASRQTDKLTYRYANRRTSHPYRRRTNEACISSTADYCLLCCKQTHLSLNNNLLLRLPDYFTDPDKFIPERWVRDGLANNVHPYLLLPFGFGVRTCAGQLMKHSFEVSLMFTPNSVGTGLS